MGRGVPFVKRGVPQRSFYSSVIHFVTSITCSLFLRHLSTNERAAG